MSYRVLIALLIALLFWAGLSFGRTILSPADLWAVLRDHDAAEGWFLVLELRLPRLLTALGAGAALGLGGAICQSLFRNPLAAPEILGVSAGASLGAVSLVLAGLQGAALAGGATMGAALAAFALLALAGTRAGVMRLVLTGIGISMTLSAITGFLLSRADDALAGDAILWMTGSLNGRYWPQAALIWVCLPPLAIAAALSARALDRMELGDDLAQSLGVPVGIARPLVILLAAGLVAAAVSVAGPIGFVGFMAGPVTRYLNPASGPDLTGAALAGALILLLADLMVTLTAPLALLPVGIFTGLIGAPWLIWLLARNAAGGKKA